MPIHVDFVRAREFTVGVIFTWEYKIILLMNKLLNLTQVINT